MKLRAPGAHPACTAVFSPTVSKVALSSEEHLPPGVQCSSHLPKLFLSYSVLRYTSPPRGERIYLERETNVCVFGPGGFIPVAFFSYTITTWCGDCPSCGRHLVNDTGLHRSSPDSRSTLSPPGKHLARIAGVTAPGTLPVDTSTTRPQAAKTRNRILCHLRGDRHRAV